MLIHICALILQVAIGVPSKVHARMLTYADVCVLVLILQVAIGVPSEVHARLSGNCHQDPGRVQQSSVAYRITRTQIVVRGHIGHIVVRGQIVARGPSSHQDPGIEYKTLFVTVEKRGKLKAWAQSIHWSLLKKALQSSKVAYVNMLFRSWTGLRRHVPEK